MQPPPPADLEGRLIANSVHARLFGGERPTRIGNYVIIRRIGGGAMGDVFLAHHESLDRQAAIKLVRPAAEDSTIERQRLLREATILAKIDHPHVIGVHDSGTHDNRVYLAMEYVKGVTLGVWQKGRPWRALLDVYLKAGRGLQAVHAVVLDADERAATGTTRRSLCHRDFKPDNVLISDHGDVRVADFGLAVPTQRREPGQGGRAIDLRLTADASVVGTPLYISPEQLSGSPGDARSDQYSFCVALYEALYDQHPYYAPAPAVRDSDLATDSGGPGRTHPQYALFEAILGAPLRPMPRSKVPRRIHTILARGLQRDPANRYPSMAALLAALEHDPKRRPLQAFAGIAVIGTAFTIGMSLATAIPEMCSNIEQETASLWNDARRAEVKAAFKATGASYADSSFAAVEFRIKSYLERWTEARQTACDATYLSSSRSTENNQQSMACLDQHFELVRSTITGFSTDPISTMLGADERLASLPQPEDCNALLLNSRRCTSEPLLDTDAGRIRATIKAAQAAEFSGHIVTAEPLAASAADAALAHGWPSLVIDAHLSLGRVLSALGRPQAARDALLMARDAAETAGCDALVLDVDSFTTKLVALHPSLDSGIGTYAAATGFQKLRRAGAGDARREAQLLTDRGLLHEYRYDDNRAAEQDYRAALAVRIRNDLDNSMDQARTLQNLGAALHKQGRTTEALVVLDDALVLYEQTYGEYHPDLWKPLFNLGAAQHEAGLLTKANTTMTKALDLAKVDLGDTSPDVRDIHAALARLAFDQGDGLNAEGHSRAGLVGCAPKTTEPTCLMLKLKVAHARVLQGDASEALAIREQVFATTRRHSSENALTDQRIDLASSYVSLERWGDALAHGTIAKESLANDSDPRMPELALYLGAALYGLGRLDEAIQTFEMAYVHAGAEDDGIRATAAWGLGQAWCSSGRAPVEAKRFTREARVFFAPDAGDPETADLLRKIDTLLDRPCLSKPKR